MNLTIQDNLPAEEYHRDPSPGVPSLSSSIAKILIQQSPLHAWTAHPRLNPNQVDEEDEKFDIGTAAHALLCEGLNKMVEVAFDNWRTKAAQTMREQLRAEKKLPILSKHVGRVQQMVINAHEALAEAPDVGLAVAQCWSERTVLWEEQTPFGPCCVRTRPDLWSHHRPLLVDYKTVENANPMLFARHAEAMGYDIQAAMHIRAWRLAQQKEGIDGLLLPDPGYVWLVQERAQPFACSFVSPDSTLLEMGAQKFQLACEVWTHCLMHNKWPGFRREIYWAESPAWALAQWEERKLAYTQGR